MISIHAVIFDFNGTLFLDDEKHYEAWGRISEEIRHRPILKEELMKHCNGFPNEQVIAYLTDNRLTAKDNKQLSMRKEEYYRTLCLEDPQNFHLQAGVESYFDFLTEQQVPFTIASASIKENMEFFYSSFHLKRWLSFSSLVYDDGTHTDKASMFLKAAAELHADPKYVLIFEDSLSGMHSALKAGFPYVIGIGDKQKASGFKEERLFAVLSDFRDIQNLLNISYHLKEV